ncbi:hypothetical protein J2793_007350 [Paraburkholderia caledonica]|uniref:Transposase IS66 central domain-containing protein n=1 Tax=Paraburkholderia caledonica TaxID=134536 RepID=A0AB73IPN3_9BURK|nr:hypothetical protein [Paraburkholderia caledonica]
MFSYSPTRSAAQAAVLYAGIKHGAVLMSDGYEPHNEIARTNQLVHLGCWARARRYLIEAEEDLPKVQRGGNHSPDRPAVCGEARSEHMTPEQRQQLRQVRNQPVLDQIEALLSRHLNTVLPQSGFGKAPQYLRGQWPKLVRYVGNGAWPISNNPCENAIRPFTVGRRNW